MRFSEGSYPPESRSASEPFRRTTSACQATYTVRRTVPAEPRPSESRMPVTWGCDAGPVEGQREAGSEDLRVARVGLSVDGRRVVGAQALRAAGYGFTSVLL